MQKQRESIAAAIGVMGKNQENDYVLDPTGHADRFSDSASSLAAILGGEAVKFLALEYKKRDGQAIDAQNQFKTWTRRMLWFVFASSVATATLATAGPLFAAWDVSLNPLLWLLAAVGAASAALAGVSMSYVRSEKLLDKWMTRRAEAETLRLEYFSTVTAPPEGNADSALSLLQLEYFRRFQLDVQLAFYDRRGTEHDRAASNAAKVGLLLMMGGAVINAVAGTAAGAWTAVALFAFVAQALAARTSSLEAVNLDTRNAERYDRTHAALARVKTRLDQVRPAVAAGDRAVLESFVKAVHEQLSLEHRQWLDQFEDRHSAISQLERQLENGRGEAPERA